MIGFIRRCSRRFLLGTVTVSLVAGMLAPSGAHAGFTTCQSDPVVLLSNGGAVDLKTSINDSLMDVRQVVYTVHVPSGVGVLGVVNTDSLIGLVETVQVYSDDAAHTYDTSAEVSTGASSVGVRASSTVVSALDLVLGGQSISGTTGQVLSMHFTTLL